MDEVKSPRFSLKGFDFSTLWAKNVEKWDTYLKIIISCGLAYYISDDTIVQGLSIVGSKIILDIIHFFFIEVKNGTK